MDPSLLMTDAGRAAWLEARRHGLGSSDAAAIMGLSPWSSPLHVYLSKTGEWQEPDSPRLRWGRKLEEVVADAYQEVTGNLLQFPPAATLAHRDLPWMMASVDRLAAWDNKLRVVELKTAGHRSDEWGEPGTDEIPDHYLIQIQHQLAVLDSYYALDDTQPEQVLPLDDTADLAVLFAGSEFAVYHVRRNERVIAALATIESDFWGQVQRRQAPEPDWQHPRTLELLSKLYSVHDDGPPVVLGNDAQRWAETYLAARQDVANAKGEQHVAKAHLLDLMGAATLARLPGGITLTRKRVQRRGYSVDPCEYVDFRVKLPKGE